MEPQTQHPIIAAAPTQSGASALTAIDVCTSLPLGRERVDILKGISLTLAHGEFAAIVGPSGSGKSTHDPTAADRAIRVVDGQIANS